MSRFEVEGEDVMGSANDACAGLLRCLVCRNAVECWAEDLLHFTRTKWPRCCGDVMTLFQSTAAPPAPNEGTK